MVVVSCADSACGAAFAVRAAASASADVVIVFMINPLPE
jgi:hypothetical protein